MARKKGDVDPRLDNRNAAPVPPFPFTTEINELLFQLTEKQRDFVLYYTCGGDGIRNNGTQSAIRAGYSKKQATITGSSLVHEHAKCKRAIELIRLHVAKQHELDFNAYINLLLQQANSWLTPEGKPLQTPLVQGGKVVMYEQVVVDKDGIPIIKDNEILTVTKPVLEQWRSNSSNTQALHLLGVSLGYVSPPRARPDTGVVSPEERGGADAPTKGYKQDELGETSLDDFLKTLPAPSENGPRTGSAGPEGTVASDSDSE